MPYECASFFSGVGGIDLGFHNGGDFVTVYANEFDTYPAKTFNLNFPDVPMTVDDIRNINCDDIPDFDVMLAGFPCQAFSIAGLRQGFDDAKGRGELFFELARILENKHPRAVLLENVKNLVSHDNGNTFRVICQQLAILGYHYDYRVLNAMEYGNMAQNRERIYIVAFRDEADFNNFHWPEPITRTRTVMDIIDFHARLDDRYYYTPGKYKGNIYEQLNKAMENDNIDDPAIYQWRRKYVRQNKSGVVPTLTANQGEGGHNVCIVKTDYGIRKMTPRECFNAQGFPEDFILPGNMAESRLYKQAGNSVCVPVIQRIAEQMYQAMIENEPQA